MPKLIDLTGKRFGRLTVIERAPSVGCNTMWHCVCDCGNKTIKQSSCLRKGETMSCGCLYKETHYKHGKTGTRLYHVWRDMIARCRYPSVPCYPTYGGRGIKVCDEWQSFDSFYKWALGNGYDENAPSGDCTIDRIDVNGNYEPSNCRWVNRIVQQSNTTKNRLIAMDGKTQTLAQWSREYDIKPQTVMQRISVGWDWPNAIKTKPRPTRPKRNQNTASFNGETKTVSDWAKYFGVGHRTIARRLANGKQVDGSRTKEEL